MSSSFPKHFALHRCIGFLVALAVIGSFGLVHTKICKDAGVPYEIAAKELKWNLTLIEPFVERFYFELQLYHVIILAIAIIIILLGFVNIAPKNDDIRFGFHFLALLIIGSTAILSLYSSYSAYQKPCSDLNSTTSVNSIPSSGRAARPKGAGMWIYTADPKHGDSVNVWDFPDFEMQLVTGVDALTGLLLVISTIVFCIDAREQAMQDEYVVRPGPKTRY